ncbi:hypothetical protein BGX29_004660 [Mortierella sp. GBA35]|nr:hypothetical protein BGX29_004660 [Mortierella sp. GBA35]
MTNGGASAHRLKHAENERDRERGGSRSLISEIYAVLRRFRKENRLVDFVREIYMDSTDSQHFPSPLVMLIKFPNLHTLSSRYRRNQTSLTTDTHTLKDLLRNGDILPHSLRLRKWDIFHPYMTKEDINGFKIILDAISAVGAERDLNGTTGSGGQGGQGVLLDIKMCPGPVVYEPNAGSSLDGSQVHVGGGMHWATPNGHYQQQHQHAAPVATTHSIPPSTTTPPPPTEGQPVASTAPSAPPCTNIVWTLEKCRVCDASHSRCYRCVGQCSACGAVRAPPFINHQTLLERERARQTTGRAASPAVVVVAGSSVIPGAEVISGVSVAGMAAVNGNGRPRTPPGSISLSQMANSSQPIASAYHSSGGFPVLSSPFWALPVPLPVVPVALTVPPEFSLFD